MRFPQTDQIVHGGGGGGVGGGLTGELSKHKHSNAKGAEKKAKKSLYVLSVPSFFLLFVDREKL